MESGFCPTRCWFWLSTRWWKLSRAASAARGHGFGCDGRAKSRDYCHIIEFAKAPPQDTVILTAGCAGTSITSWSWQHQRHPALDAGQCNDSTSGCHRPSLQEIFGLTTSMTRPSLITSPAWQKAVIVLLTCSVGREKHPPGSHPACLSLPPQRGQGADRYLRHIAGIGTVERIWNSLFRLIPPRRIPLEIRCSLSKKSFRIKVIGFLSNSQKVLFQKSSLIERERQP